MITFFQKRIRTQSLVGAPAASVQGITVLELLVALLVAGGTLAVAFPALQHYQAKAQERQSRSYLKALSQAQRQHYLLNQSFAKAPASLDLEREPKTQGSYEYSIAASNDGKVVTHKARSRSRNLRNQVSVMAVGEQGAIVDGLLCEADDPSSTLLDEGQLVGGILLCPPGYSPQR